MSKLKTPTSLPERLNIVDLYHQESKAYGELIALERLHLALTNSPEILYERDSMGQTLLHYAAKYGQKTLFDLVIYHVEFSVNKSVEDIYAQSIEYYHRLGREITEVDAKELRNSIAESVASENRHLKIINALDIAKATPSHIAASKGHFSIVAALALKGADLTIESDGSPTFGSPLKTLLHSNASYAKHIALKYVEHHNIANKLSQEDQSALKLRAEEVFAAMKGESVDSEMDRENMGPGGYDAPSLGGQAAMTDPGYAPEHLGDVAKAFTFE